MTLSNYLRSGVAALAIAAVLPSTANANDPSIHPLLAPAAGNIVAPTFAKAVVAATGNELDSAHAGKFLKELFQVISVPASKPRPVITPKDAVVGQLSFVGIVPPNPNIPIGVCLQQGIKNDKGEMVHTNLGTFQIHPDGRVVSQAWNGVKVGGEVNGKFQAACIPYFRDYVAFINKEAARMAATQPEAPTPPAPATTPPVALVGSGTRVAAATP